MENLDIKGKGVEGVKKIGGGLKSQVTGFIDFIRTQGVVGFAVAFVLGGAVSVLVTSFVNNLVNPVLGIALGSAKDLAENSFKLLEAEIKYGKFLNDLINFIVIAFVVYFGVKKLGLDRLDKPKK